MTPPLVSIIIPCYNAERWVAAALDSALAQTWKENEIILINDGSRDGSLALARGYETQGVRVLDQPNRGAAAARNAGLRAARGDFVQFLDADDLLAPDKVAQQLSRLASAGPGVLASSAWARFHDHPAQAVFVPQPNWRDLTGTEFLTLHYEEGCMMQPAAWLAPRALLDRAGPWDESLTLNDDGEYFARVMLTAERILFCGAARSYYRSALPGSLSGRRDRSALGSLYKSVELTVSHLLAADNSTHTRAAAAHAWKWTAFELYPERPDLSRRAEANSRGLGGSSRPLPGGGPWFTVAARLLGWKFARRLQRWRQARPVIRSADHNPS